MAGCLTFGGRKELGKSVWLCCADRALILLPSGFQLASCCADFGVLECTHAPNVTLDSARGLCPCPLNKSGATHVRALHCSWEMPPMASGIYMPLFVLCSSFSMLSNFQGLAIDIVFSLPRFIVPKSYY